MLDTSVPRGSQDDRLFYDFILNWNQTKVLYEEELEKFLTEWFNQK